MSIPWLIITAIISIAVIFLLLYTIATGITEQQEKGWKESSAAELIKVLSLLTVAASHFATAVVLVISAKTATSLFQELELMNPKTLTGILVGFVIISRITRK